VGSDVEVAVGGAAPSGGRKGPSLGERGRAAELASEAARAEGASLTRHRPWPARRSDRNAWLAASGAMLSKVQSKIAA
jgi:hypothetical protein